MTTKLRVTTIAATDFWQAALPVEPTKGWKTDATGGSALIEFAGRACYQSWTKPNPATATNAGYIKHLLDSSHTSVLEHASVTFYIEGVSRSLTHELVRHRAGFAFSQLSQRYVNEATADMVVPDAIRRNANLAAEFDDVATLARGAYAYTVELLEERFADVPDTTLRRKLARQAARALLPNATETKIVVTANLRAWRHFVRMRATEHADVEIRALAVEILRRLQQLNRGVFDDFVISSLDDGTEIATSPYST